MKLQGLITMFTVGLNAKLTIAKYQNQITVNNSRYTVRNGANSAVSKLRSNNLLYKIISGCIN